MDRKTRLTRRLVLRLSALMITGVPILSSHGADVRRFTVRDSIEMARFGVGEDSEPDDVDDDGISSPDGRQVVKISHRGVLPACVLEGTIWLFDAVAIKAGIKNPKLSIPPPVALTSLSAAVNGIDGRRLF